MTTQPQIQSLQDDIAAAISLNGTFAVTAQTTTIANALATAAAAAAKLTPSVVPPAPPTPTSNVPGQPTGLTATATGTTVALAWTNGSGTTGVYVYQDGSKIAGPSGTATSFSVTGVTPGAHSFYVIDYNAVGNSTKSATVNATVTTVSLAALANQSWTENVAITAVVPVATGGTTPYAWTITPALPTGLALSSSTGHITGTPTVSVASTAYTVKVTDDNGLTASRTFTIVVAPPVVATMQVGLAMGYDPTFDSQSDSGLAQDEVMQADGFWGVRRESIYGSSGGGGSQANIQADLDAGLNVLLLLDVDGTSIPAIGNTAFVTFVQEQVTYWSPKGIHHYEILNEPNLAANWDSTDNYVNPAAYAVLLGLCYSAIKAIDPTALVSSGGVTTNSTSDGASDGSGNYTSVLLPNSFIYLMYEAMGGSSVGYCDAIGMHPYTEAAPSIGNGSNWGYFLNPSGTHPYAESSVGAGWNSILAIMEANGESAKPIWITEYGYDAPTDVTDAQQASYLTTALTMAAAVANVAFFFVFNWNDDADGDWGLETSSYAAKPALAAVLDFMGNTQPPPVTPAAPVLATPSVSGTSVTLNWSSATNAATYVVYVDGAVKASGLTALTYIANALSVGAHTFQVFGVNTAGSAGPGSNSESATVAGSSGTVVPNAPATISGITVPTTPVFDDEFPGPTLNTALGWQAITAPSDNGTPMSPSNVSFGANGIQLYMNPNGSGAFVTTGTQFFNTSAKGFTLVPTASKPVYIEFKADFPLSGSETANWPAAWLSNSGWGTSSYFEIDVAEGLSGRLCATIHYASTATTSQAIMGSGGAMHTYGVLWTTTHQYFVLDGVVVGSTAITASTLPCGINLEQADGSDGGPKTTGVTVTFRYVRAFQ